MYWSYLKEIKEIEMDKDIVIETETSKFELICFGLLTFAAVVLMLVTALCLYARTF